MRSIYHYPSVPGIQPLAAKIKADQKDTTHVQRIIANFGTSVSSHRTSATSRISHRNASHRITSHTTLAGVMSVDKLIVVKSAHNVLAMLHDVCVCVAKDAHHASCNGFATENMSP